MPNRRLRPRPIATLVAAALVMAGCGFGEDPTKASQAVIQRLDELAADPEVADLAEVTEPMVETDDPRWVPYLLDLLSFEIEPSRIEVVTDALASLTGVTPGPDPIHSSVTYGTWMIDREIVPISHYPAWKARLWGHVDDEFQGLIEPLEPAVAARVQWGGVPFDGIPALDDPVVITPESAAYLAPSDLVFGAVVDGTARAYPLRILDFHEMSNDRIGDEPVVLANCTLCRSGILYQRIVGPRVLDFVTSGLLLESNKLMVDLQTRTLWEQLSGRAVSGPLAGEQLTPLFFTTTTWEDWRTSHPDTGVLALPDTGGPAGAIGGFSYAEGDAYADYYATEELWFAAPTPAGGRPKIPVAGALVDDVPFAIEIEALTDHGPITIDVGETAITAVPTAGGGARIYRGDLDGTDVSIAGETTLVLADGRTLPRIPATPSFWFAWAGRHPDSDRWP